MSSPVEPQVVCIGVVTLDALALVDEYPGQDERVVAREIRFAGGGPAATAAVVLARQGVGVSFVGRVGVDDAGEQALSQLIAEGVDVSGVHRSEDVATQVSCVVVSDETQSRAISTLTVPPLTYLTPAAREKISEADWVHCDHLGFAPVADLLKGIGSRPKVSLDAGNEVAGLDLSLVDLFVPTVGSLCATAGLPRDPDGAARRMVSAGVRAVVATDGAEGSYAWWGEESPIPVSEHPGKVFVPAVEGVKIASTLGAGDVFHGGLLAAICRGEDWKQALRSANATAALSCRALDGRSAIPTLTELTEFLNRALER